VAIKLRLVNLRRASRRSTQTHLRYLELYGVAPEGERGHAYGAIADSVDLKDFEHRGQGDRHQFRFIVSAEDGTELEDLKAFTRDLMTRVKRDLGTRLDWIAVGSTTRATLVLGGSTAVSQRWILPSRIGVGFGALLPTAPTFCRRWGARRHHSHHAASHGAGEV
jgi:hypothetical protein